MNRKFVVALMVIASLGTYAATDFVRHMMSPPKAYGMAGYPMQSGGKVTVTTSGTRVQLTSTIDSANGLYIEADENNTGTIYVGTSGVSSSAYVTRLTAGQAWSWSVEEGGGKINPKTIYIDASSNTQSVQWGFY